MNDLNPLNFFLFIYSTFIFLGEAIEQIDYDYKTRLMEATLSVADVEPRWGVDELKHIESELIQLIDEEGLGCVVSSPLLVFLVFLVFSVFIPTFVLLHLHIDALTY